MRFVNVAIEEGDNLPKLICTSCTSELAISYEFVQKCEASDQALRSIAIKTDPYEDFKDVPLVLKYEDIKEELDDHINHDFNEDSKEYDDVKPKNQYTRKKKKNRSKLGPIQCSICGLVVISHSAMEIHMRTHTGEKPFLCESCDQRFPTKGSLKRHVTTFHTKRERKFICEMCGNSFFTKNDIITHMRIHTDEKPYGCSYCSKRFRQIASLIRHKRTHTGEKPYSCPICDKQFSDKSLVNKHLTVHSNERKFSCHLCNKTFKSKTALNTHLSLHTNEKRNICSFCGMAFSMKGNLQTHIRRMHSEKSGQCPTCMKTFADLEEHMRKHTGEKPFVCEICSQSFASKRSLAYHMVFKHENTSKFKCSIGECTKTFPRAMMLEFHLLKQHTNHTPYICPHCARGFFRTSDLSRHLRISHMELQKGALIRTIPLDI